MIDHLLPQDLSNKTEDERQEIYRWFLPDSLLVGSPPIEFDLHSLVNLAPSCSRDNGIKSAELAKITGLLLVESVKKLPEVERLATRFKNDREWQRAFAIIESSDQAAVGNAVARLVGSGIDTDIIRKLVRLNVAYGVVEYRSFYGDPATRRLWLVVPPGEQPLAVVLEEAGDPGTSIQNAAEWIAETLHQQYPGFLTVLHYDKEADRPWGNFWKPIPIGSDGRGEFRDVSPETRRIMFRSLKAAGLISDDAE